MKGWHGWLALCLLHAGASLLVWFLGAGAADALSWRADDWTRQPWTLWSSAWVHLSASHLIGNLMSLGALAAFGWLARPCGPSSLAWLLAWPLTQASLLLWPQIDYAVGLSGLLHAAVAVLGLQLLCQRQALAQRWGLLLALGLLLKLALERGWTYPLAWLADGDMTVVRAAHLSGAFWGGALIVLGQALRWCQAKASGAPVAQ
ncbi:rhomboid family intramembrane serine protease [Hydrogenophaga sp.]|uniref:rhomboid family intramembrane serine protease n=1 Tax=Hydrogenophaga sp. TaxID=1904254 RepID=UPI001998AB73|nr:rhomboid family intramembrane serine protease [Hydrogenophaga sp.]MBD3893132.1 rhomboid family intramembrane serine protease [Hydrogenophaga sp.]